MLVCENLQNLAKLCCKGLEGMWLGVKGKERIKSAFTVASSKQSSLTASWCRLSLMASLSSVRTSPSSDMGKNLSGCFSWRLESVFLTRAVFPEARRPITKTELLSAQFTVDDSSLSNDSCWDESVSRIVVGFASFRRSVDLILVIFFKAMVSKRIYAETREEKSSKLTSVRWWMTESLCSEVVDWLDERSWEGENSW